MRRGLPLDLVPRLNIASWWSFCDEQRTEQNGRVLPRPNRTPAEAALAREDVPPSFP